MSGLFNRKYRLINCHYSVKVDRFMGNVSFTLQRFVAGQGTHDSLLLNALVLKTSFEGQLGSFPFPAHCRWHTSNYLPLLTIFTQHLFNLH